MRNHNEKSRDMARSVLPSTARRRARDERALIHSRERASARRELRVLAHLEDVDDFEGDLTWEDRRARKDMVLDRRAADKVVPLIRWVEATIEADPLLRTASAEHQEVHFAALLPDGVIGQHALSHLWLCFGDRASRWTRDRARTDRPDPREADRVLVREIVAAGAHGELNRHLRRVIADRLVSVKLPERRIVDAEHPPPGLLMRACTVKRRAGTYVRYLAGAHDVAAFVAGSSGDALEAIRDFHAQMASRRKA